MIQIDERLAHRLQTEKIAWFTTVRADGMPLPTPVWFWWDGATCLIWSQPDALKLRNLARNPAAALHFNTDATGELFVILTGEAAVDSQPAPPADRQGFLAKYYDDIRFIGFTPERLDAEFSILIRFQPSRVRAQLDLPAES